MGTQNILRVILSDGLVIRIDHIDNVGAIEIRPRSSSAGGYLQQEGLLALSAPKKATAFACRDVFMSFPL